MSVKRTRRKRSSAPVRGLSAHLKKAGQGIASFFRAAGRGIASFFRLLGRGIAAAFRAVGRGVAACFRLLGRGLSALGRGIRRARCLLLLLLFIGVLFGILALTVSGGVVRTTRGCVLTPGEAQKMLADGETFDCMLILGAGLRDDGSPSPMLYDRVVTGMEVWVTAPDACGPLLMSGDHTGDYNEPAAMKSLAESLGADGHAVFLDHEGYSTYESLLRARDVFGATRVLIVTQEYHLYRAVYIARSLGLDAYGVAADRRPYTKQLYRECREVLARYKDFMASARADALPPGHPTVDLSGDGDDT